MIDISNENVPGNFLLLEMAFYAERRVTFIQQSLIDRAVRRMTDDAALTHRFVFIDEWAALLCVTLETGFVSSQERQATGSELLLNICRGALRCDAFVRFVAIGAAHFAFKDRMMMR